ncbi:polysaccharide deacetylase family protein [Brasilonema bromeliae]|uniref:Polysaccharide deacetylase family protein n=1 Tax=Brasilonema bromeliae SPC951 TaxID=385972 RepID=A0ABX1PEH3_9CYAN|nr:polysaccharide deacetylase family protein [Brasilonema bromeliae SPC951]
METNKSYVWSHGILIAAVCFCASLSVGLVMPVNPNTSEAQTKQTTNVKETGAKVGTQKRIETFKAAMLTSWQEEAKTKGFSYDVPSRFHGAVVESAKLTKGEKVIALTFDDGPWAGSTAEVLDILKKNNIKATFFVVGQMLKTYPELGKRIVAEGHVIGNHTWHHWYHYFNPQAAAYEIDSTTDLIYQITGARTTLFRPPGGIMHNGVAAYAKNRNYTLVMWSADSVDYSRPALPKLIRNVMRNSKPGGIVLMHDGGGNRSRTVQALPEIISNFRKQGYRFVTVPELLEIENRELQLAAAQKSNTK